METVANQRSVCITSNTSHLPKHSILKCVLDLQLLSKVKLCFFVLLSKSEVKIKQTRRKWLIPIAIENHSICCPKICRKFKWMGKFNQEHTMATLARHPIVWEIGPSHHASNTRWCNWLWIFEKYVQFERRRNIWDWGYGARFLHYADISELRQTTNQS